MPEDDRAAKAARAKALLKKRQQKKAADSSATASSSVGSPVTPQRTFSPAPSEPVEEDKHDINDIFTKSDGDTSWLSSLPRATSPPSRLSSPLVTSESKHPSPATGPPTRSSLAPPPTNGDAGSSNEIAALRIENASLAEEAKRLRELETQIRNTGELLEKERAHVKDLEESHKQLQADTETSLENERQTISLLVSEKATLIADLQRLEGLDSKAQATETLLQEERDKAKALDDRIQQLLSDIQTASQRAERSEAKEKELSERFREQERHLQLATASAAESRKEAEQYQRKLKELEEQIQSDDRVERLETSLKNTQDRADDLEFHLSKLKQTHTTLKNERDELDARCRAQTDSEEEWKSKHSELLTQHTSVEEKLSSTISEKNELVDEKSQLQSQIDADQKAISELQEKLQQAASEMATNVRQLHNAQNELKKAVRRADDAEQMQKNLQTEGTTLMRSLDEMRPKIVELTGAKLDLAEKVEGLQHSLRSRDATISELESTLDELRDQSEKSETAWKEKLSHREKEHIETQSGSSELQKAYTDLQDELDTALASLRNLESERNNHHQEAGRRLEEIERLNSLYRTQAEELSAAQQELDSRRTTEEEDQDFLERTRNEIEGLRSELSMKDEEIERLQETISSPSRENAPHSLNDEMLSSLRQQHALDLSAAQSQIRALEDSVFDAGAKSHALQKKVNSLEEQLARQSRPGQRSFSPAPSRASSHLQRDSDLRRSSFGSHRPSSNLAPQLSRSVFDQNLSPETLHKRKVSLSMLKARIDSEVAATSHPPSRALSPVHSLSGHEHDSPTFNSQPHIHRPQFLDESHVFWCHSCRGDLVIL